MKKKPLSEEAVRARELRKELKQMHEEISLPFSFYALLVLLIWLVASVFAPVLTRSERENKVMTADTITVQEKRIAFDDYVLVLTDGKDTFSLKVSETIYNKYHLGDIYEHDADQKKYVVFSAEGDFYGTTEATGPCSNS